VKFGDIEEMLVDIFFIYSGLVIMTPSSFGRACIPVSLQVRRLGAIDFLRLRGSTSEKFKTNNDED
jgi:hypothetical protein